MQTHLMRHFVPKVGPNVERLRGIIRNGKNAMLCELLQKRLVRGLRAVSKANEQMHVDAGVGERWHALVRFEDRQNPIKFHPMTRSDAFERNASIRDLGMEWVLQNPMR